MNAHGCDVSRYQYPVNYKKGFENGLRYVFVRATIGDYYQDPTFHEMFTGYRNAGYLVSGYLVTAPKDPSLTRKISVDAHLNNFLNFVGDLKPDMPWCVDAELQRGETNAYITQLHKGVVNGLKTAYLKYPIIYTRQTWWDAYVNADPMWSKCDLFAARYAEWLTSPWSDGRCKFRDWNIWRFWQYTSHGDGPYWGFTSLNGDLDWFNGDEGMLYNYAGLPQPLSLTDKVNILWREAQLHGWNLMK